MLNFNFKNKEIYGQTGMRIYYYKIREEEFAQKIVEVT